MRTKREAVADVRELRENIFVGKIVVSDSYGNKKEFPVKDLSEDDVDFLNEYFSNVDVNKEWFKKLSRWKRLNEDVDYKLRLSEVIKRKRKEKRKRRDSHDD